MFKIIVSLYNNEILQFNSLDSMFRYICHITMKIYIHPHPRTNINMFFKIYNFTYRISTINSHWYNNIKRQTKEKIKDGKDVTHTF